MYKLIIKDTGKNGVAIIVKMPGALTVLDGLLLVRTSAHGEYPSQIVKP